MQNDTNSNLGITLEQRAGKWVSAAGIGCCLGCVLMGVVDALARHPVLCCGSLALLGLGRLLGLIGRRNSAL